jgi:hypothetical protein
VHEQQHELLVRLAQFRQALAELQSRGDRLILCRQDHVAGAQPVAVGGAERDHPDHQHAVAIGRNAVSRAGGWGEIGQFQPQIRQAARHRRRRQGDAVLPGIAGPLGDRGEHVLQLAVAPDAEIDDMADRRFGDRTRDRA